MICYFAQSARGIFILELPDDHGCFMHVLMVDIVISPPPRTLHGAIIKHRYTPIYLSHCTKKYSTIPSSTAHICYTSVHTYTHTIAHTTTIIHNFTLKNNNNHTSIKRTYTVYSNLLVHTHTHTYTHVCCNDAITCIYTACTHMYMSA